MHVFNFSVSFPYCEYWKSLHYLVFHPRFDSWDAKIHWRSDRLPTPVFLGFLCGSAGKESICNVGDLGLSPGLGRSPREVKGYPLQYSGLENFMGSQTVGQDSVIFSFTFSHKWKCESRSTWLGNQTLHFHIIPHFSNSGGGEKRYCFKI